jgi:hypothetical protein
MIFYCTKRRLSNGKCNDSWVISVKTANFKLQLPSIIVFLVFSKNDLTKRYLSSDSVPAHKILQSYVDWENFFIHLRSLTVLHFG